MDCIDVSFRYGWIIRQDALAELGLSLEDVLAALHVASPLDVNDQLISLETHCAPDGPDGVVLALRTLGLRYFDDFVELVGAFPPWCRFKAGFEAD